MTSNLFENKISTVLAFLIILGIIIPTGYITLRSWENTIYTIDIEISEPITMTKSNKTNNLPDAEKQKIQDWIVKNHLNEYGDPQGTVYAGGTPLFNEMTGKKIDRYEYIVQKHSDRPWNN